VSFVSWDGFTRVVAVDVPHHVTQRGNGRRFILDCDADRAVYLNLLQQNIDLYGVSPIGYCLLSNHVHLVVVPRKPDAWHRHLNRRTGAMRRTGTPLTNRLGMCGKDDYYSCPLDEPHLWAALRYTELNALRAGLVSEVEL